MKFANFQTIFLILKCYSLFIYNTLQLSDFQCFVGIYDSLLNKRKVPIPSSFFWK